MDEFVERVLIPGYTRGKTGANATKRVAERRHDDALLSGGLTTLGNLFADDLVVRQPPYLPWGAEHRTLAGVAALTGPISEHLNAMKMTVDRIVADGDTAIGLLRFPDLKTGENVIVAEELTVRDGKVAQARLYYHDTQAVPLNSARNRT
ncbi:nuclear transport factor 2 family protein [Streptomyces sp. NPDC097610]|uniref:nuclear transport factor 2 family protein n=1 Tax=Streptomyces sp. NPDC097610 TaxID=3157227 RepID=UPI0033191D1B